MLKVVNLSSNYDLQNWIMILWVSYEKRTYKRCEKGFSTSNANIIEKFRLGRDLLQSLNCPPAQSRANLCVAQGFFFCSCFENLKGWRLGLVPGLYHSLESCFLYVPTGISLVAAYVHCLLPFHCASLRKVWLSSILLHFW